MIGFVKKRVILPWVDFTHVSAKEMVLISLRLHV